jgi:phosphatidylinositol-bisphosphatase
VSHEANVDEAVDLLINKDQLVIERAAGRVFKGFDEGRLLFMPTYKCVHRFNLPFLSPPPPAPSLPLTPRRYIPTNQPNPGDRETDWYDDRPDKKMRCPAWCDRVLWRVQDGCCETVKLLQYRRTDGIYISDHKPVNALLECQIKQIDREKREEILQSIVKQSHEKVEELHVACKVTGAWEFETDGHDQDEISVVTLENLSKTAPAKWSLENGKAGVPCWMRVLTSFEGELGPGEKIEMRARIEPDIDGEYHIDDSNENAIDDIHPGAIIKVNVHNGNTVYVACMNKWLDRRQKERAAAATTQARESSTAKKSGGGFRDSMKHKMGWKKS